MAFVSSFRMRFRPGTGQYVERFYTERFVPGRQPLFESGDLLSMALLRIEVPGDRAETYELVSYWANKAAHNRAEDSPLDEEAAKTLVPYLATPEKEVRRSQRRAYLQRFAVYGLLSALVVALYIGSIVGLQAVMVRLTGQSSAFALVVTTLAFAALLQTARRRLQELVDRRFFRSRYAAAQAVAAFGELARNEVDVARLTDQLLEVVTKTVQPEYAFLWVITPHGAVQEAGQTRLVQPVLPRSSTSGRATADATP